VYGLGVLAVAACGATSILPLVDTGTPALHAVESQRLQTLMRELNRLAPERFPKEFDVRRARARRLDEVSAVAESIASTAKRMPEAIADVDLGARDRKVFVRLAHELHDEALELQRVAAARDARAAEAVLNRLMTTCDACHSLFRRTSSPSAAH
jgi:hypothetical protein